MFDFIADAGDFLFSRQMILITVFSLCFIFICVFESCVWLYDMRQYRKWRAAERKLREMQKEYDRK